MQGDRNTNPCPIYRKEKLMEESNVLNYAKAIKEYCEEKGCCKCKFASKGNASIIDCPLFKSAPYDWEIPKEED